MGTGTTLSNDVTPNPAMWQHFLPRLYRSFMSSMDGEMIWTELCNQLPHADKYFRFNILFHGPEPEIDDLSAMRQLRERAESSPNQNKQIQGDVADTLIAKSFYFELDGLPDYHHGEYWCRGNIFCRHSGMYRAVLLQYLQQISGRFHLGDTALITELIFPLQVSSRKFCESVAFPVKTMTDEINITLSGLFKKPRLISGFPTSIARLVHAQGLQCTFGLPSHKLQVPANYTNPRPAPKRPLDGRVKPKRACRV